MTHPRRERSHTAFANSLDRQRKHFKIGFMAALAEEFDAGLPELTRAQWVGFLLNAESGAVIAEFCYPLRRAPLQENPANGDGQIGAQA